MANLPSHHSTLALHLTDRALHPLISSSRTQTHLQSLTSLSHTALSAHESALRLGLGEPQRIMVEHDANGPVLLHSYLSSRPARPPNPAGTADSAANHLLSLSLNGGAGEANLPTPGALAFAASQRINPDEEPSDLPQTHPAVSPQPHIPGVGAGIGAEPTQPFVPQTPNFRGAHDDEEEDEEDSDAPPMLVGLVVAGSSDEALEARRAAVRLERVGREVQKKWTERPPAPGMDHGGNEGEGE
ncbi:hypothetical protein F5Y15DRAFT_393225 [Xylariaceae sp. FL0016]|nr:hypothetical protein F5Y15DRAFT_393225 [Xylariaceae sp. FL0016]